MTQQLVQAAPPIVFGTDGWRARIADDYTYDNVRRCAEGVAQYVLESGTAARGVVVGYDRRFASEFFAQAASEVLLANGIAISFAAAPIPTQMVSFEVVRSRAACGVVITASHNPWTDNGFKIKSETGAAAGPDILKAVEATIASRASDEPPRVPFREAELRGEVVSFDPFEAYREFVGGTLDIDRLRAADM